MAGSLRGRDASGKSNVANYEYKHLKNPVNLLCPRRVQQVYQRLGLLLVIQREYAGDPIADTDLVLRIVSIDLTHHVSCLRYNCPV